jgi:endonuclease/exonuclease/phosphatase family metal-dependent hydrolase
MTSVLNHSPRSAILLTIVLLAGCGPRAPGAGPTPELGCRAPAVGSTLEGLRIGWHSPVPPGDDDRLARWCAEVGPPLVRGTAASEAPLDSILVVSWNIYGGGGDLVHFVADLRAGSLTAGRPVEHFLLLLQEAFRSDSTLAPPADRSAVPRGVQRTPPSGERRDVGEVAEALGLALFYAPSMRNGPDPEDRGNAILSTFPLSNPEAVELPFEAQRRVALAATITGATSSGQPWRLRFVNAHLDTRTSGRGLLASTGAGRLRQARGLLAAISPVGPTVLAGDLNTWSLRFMEGTLPFLRSHFPETPTVETGPTFRTRWGFTRRLDHVFFSLPVGWRGTYERWPDPYGSDHFPLVGWVHFR